MKKQISTLLALTLTVSMFTGCAISKNPALEEGFVDTTTSASSASSTSTDTSTEAAEAVTRDLDAAYATYPADMVVATVNGVDVKWEEYFYHSFSALMQIEQYAAITDFSADFGGMSYSDYLTLYAESNCIQYRGLETNAIAAGITISDEMQAAIDAQLEYDIASYSADGTEEGLFEYLATIYTSREMYDYFNYVAALYSEGYAVICGENGELLTDEEIQEFVDSTGLMVAKHVLISTLDADGLALSDEEKAEKLALAESIIAELSTFDGDIDEKFDELVAEYGEDPGMTYYVDGYCFAADEMVPEFEAATIALEVGEFTAEPVETDYGYHIILRCELTGESIPINQDSYLNLAQYAASNKYNTVTQEWINNSTIEYVDGFEMDFAEVFGQ